MVAFTRASRWALPLSIGTVLSVAALSGCECGHGPPVPFGLDAGRREGVLPVSPVPVVIPFDENVPAEPVRQITLDGAELLRDTPVRAYGTLDLDDDGDRDVVMTELGDDGELHFTTTRRDPTGFGPADVIFTEARPPAGCATTAFGWAAPSPSFLVASARVECEGQPSTELRFVFSHDARPRMLEVFGMTDGRIAVHVADRDHDGEDDLGLEVGLPGEGPSVTIQFWNRASGLSIDAAEPMATIASLALEAQRALRRHPEEALVSSTRAIALREALCRSSAAPRLRLGGLQGVPCDNVPPQGRAYAAHAAALARTGELAPALEAFLALDGLGIEVREAERRLAIDAWSRRGRELAEAGARIVESVEAQAATTTSAPRLSTLAFVDEGRVLVRGDHPRIVTLANGSLESVPDRGSTRIESRNGRFSLRGLETRCDGAFATIQPLVPLTDSGTRSVLVEAAPGRCDAGARGRTTETVAAARGLWPLGWAPQGMVFARASTIYVVPIDDDGAAAGAPVISPPGTPLPVPMAPGAADAAGNSFALALPIGVVLFLEQQTRAVLLRPDGYLVPEGMPIDVAVAPSGDRVAYLAGGHLRYIDRANAVPLVPPPPVVPAPSPADAPAPPPGVDPVPAEAAPAPQPAAEGTLAPPTTATP